MSLICAILLLAVPEPATVTTVRSDGAVFPATRQTPRRQKSRAVRVWTSGQALPAPGTWRDAIEPPGGGSRVAPAGDTAAPLPDQVLFDVSGRGHVTPLVSRRPARRPSTRP